LFKGRVWEGLRLKKECFGLGKNKKM